VSTRTHDPVIRRATNKDISLIRDMAVRTWRDTYSGVIPEESQDSILNVAYSMSSLLRSIRMDAFLIAEVDGEPGGFADLGMRADGTLVLHRLYVLPQVQRMGMGAALLTAAITRMLGPAFKIVPPVYETMAGRRLQAGAATEPAATDHENATVTSVHIPGYQYPLIATVEKDNPKGRAFYRKMGFAEGKEETVDLAGVPLPLVNIISSVRKMEDEKPPIPFSPPRARPSV
jgi:GNAT superfamily N-acetyltransferase